MMKSIWRPHHFHQFARTVYPRLCSRHHYEASNNVTSSQLIRKLTTPQLCRPRSFASGASYSEDNCPHREFAKTHPDAARRVLSVPPFSPQDFLASKKPLSLSPVMEKNEGNPMLLRDEATLEDYLRWRGWDIEGKLSEFKLGDDDFVHSAVGLLSHTLTFPLTLGQHVNTISPPLSQNTGVDGSSKKQHHLRLCCVGARAECTLPDDYWREFLVAAMSANQADADDNERSEQSFHCTIDFIGPDVPNHLKSKTISLVDNGGCPQQQQTKEQQQQTKEYQLTMNYHASFLHEVVLKLLKSSHMTNNSNDDNNIQSSHDRTDQIRQFWDGFVLFNPGLGHPNLAKQWKPTLKFLLGTGKPILFTAHSAIDAGRDRAVLEELLVSCDRPADNNARGGSVEYVTNPYASRMGFVDPFYSPGAEGTKVHIVTPNHSAFMLQ